MSTPAIELIEKVDMDKLRIIRDNAAVIYERMGKKCKMYDNTTKSWEVPDFKSFETRINDYYNEKMKSDKMGYRYDKKTKYGRRVSMKLSLQGLPRPIRHAISKMLYYDLDIKNAHPEILWRWCKTNQYAHPQLEDYITNRQEWFSRYHGVEMKEWDEKTKTYKRYQADDESIKRAVLAYIYGGASRPVYPDEKMKEFEKRQDELKNEFYNESKHPENHKYAQRARNNGKDYNKEGSCLSYYLCDVEDAILQLMEEYAKANDIEVGALCFDGFMLYQKDVDKFEGGVTELCKELTEYISEKMGYPFRVAHKPMDEEVSLDGLVKKEELDVSDSAYGKYLYEKLKDDVKYHSRLKTLYIYDGSLALWKKTDFDCLFHLVPPILLPHINNSPDKKVIETEVKRITSTSVQRSILAQFKSLVCSKSDDEFIHTKFDTLEGVLPIKNNLVVELSTNTTRQRKREDYFTKFIERDWLALSKEQEEKCFTYYEEVLSEYREDEEGNVIIKKPTKEHVECLISCMAYIMTGENSLQRFIQLIGVGQNGKSLFLELHEDIMGSFSVRGNKRTFIKKNNESVHDAEKIALLNTRMVVLSELSEDDEFNEPFLKLLTGGDKDNVRPCNSPDTFSVRFNCVPVIATNFVSKFSQDKAFHRRLLCFCFANKFEVNKDKKTELMEQRDAFFSYLCSYGKKFYDMKKQIIISKEAEMYTKSVKDAQNPLLLWIKENHVEVVAEETKSIKSDVLSSYLEYCNNNKIKKALGKNKFYEALEEHFKIKSVQRFDVKNRCGMVEPKPYVYLHLKMDD